ncbi:MAG: tetratricopeptide repeat protein [Planctomycetota bacterium]|jgi:tetratricopeptide (TPR) repeat protein|nr:tetratricopeptide repeat protein [Planctomycetota bacterium]
MKWESVCWVLVVFVGCALGCHRYTVHEMEDDSTSVVRTFSSNSSPPEKSGPKIQEKREPLTLFDQGVELLEKGDWDPAEALFEKVLAQEGETAEVCDLLGQTAWKRGEVQKALAYFQRAKRCLQSGRLRGDIPNSGKYREQLNRRLQAVKMDLELSNEAERVREMDEGR